MREDLDKQLCEKYPRIFKDRYGDCANTCMCWGFAHGDGWYSIIDALCSTIEAHIKWIRNQRARALVINRKLKRAIDINDIKPLLDPKYQTAEWHINQCIQRLNDQQFEDVPERVEYVVAEQVKEKFGTLRFYYRGGDATVDGMVRMAEAMSAVVCEKCSAPAKTANHDGWVGTLCEAHAKERKLARASDW